MRIIDNNKEKKAVMVVKTVVSSPFSATLLNITPIKVQNMPVNRLNNKPNSIKEHVLFIDGKLALEVTDPNPIDTQKYSKVGFEAYSSHIKIKNIKIRQVNWNPLDLSYTPEF